MSEQEETKPGNSQEQETHINEPAPRPPQLEDGYSWRTLNSYGKPEFDGPSSARAILEQVYRIEHGGGRQSAEGLGHMAGTAVLAQYREAKAEVSLRWWQSLRLMLTEGHGLVAFMVPVAALGAGVAIDVAIFGGAAEDLMSVNRWFESLAAGSLVFAAGIGLAKNNSLKTILTGLLCAATLGASMLAADNTTFKAHFANMLPDSLREQSYAAGEDLSVSQSKVKVLTDQLASDRRELDQGGIDGKPIFGDGYQGNDDQGRQLENVTIPNDEAALLDAHNSAAASSSKNGKAQAESPDKWWGQILGSLYLSAWLIASQLAIAKVIESAPANSKAGRLEAKQRRAKELLIQDLESSRGEATIRSLVGSMLNHFRDAMTDICRQNPIAQEVKSRLAELDILFSGENMEKAIQTGVKVAKDAIHPRRERFEDDDDNESGLMGKVVRLRQRQKRASSDNNPSL